ncbi:MAG: helix-turn-helix domain-containing protein [Planctomycetota bacterium]|nr:helix-turn-helix domain-containing protein [Planctomycetota bacterium]
MAVTTNQKEVFTTGEVAKICHVAPRTVSKWFDSGKLRGYRIPGSRDRRIPLAQLTAFMRAHGIPLDSLDGGLCRVLILADMPAELFDALNDSGRYKVRSAANGFEAGLEAQQFHPHVIVLDVPSEGDEAIAICRNVKAHPALQAVKVIAVAEGPADRWAERRLAEGFDACLARPYSLKQFVRAVQRATNLIT